MSSSQSSDYTNRTCMECGMVLDQAGEFHPHLFCIIKKAGGDPWRDFMWAAERLGLDTDRYGDRPPLVRDLKLKAPVGSD